MAAMNLSAKRSRQTSSLYSLRRTWPEEPGETNDYVFRYGRVDAGRCYLRQMSGGIRQWSWTIFIGTHVNRVIDGVPVAGSTATLDEAKRAFRESFEAMRAAGAVR